MINNNTLVEGCPFSSGILKSVVFILETGPTKTNIHSLGCNTMVRQYQFHGYEEEKGEIIPFLQYIVFRK